MDKVAKKEIIRFYKRYEETISEKTIVDMGSYYINGSVREILQNINKNIDVFGFDILEGNGVDVCIETGNIPKKHKNKYKVVTVVQSFQFCPEVELYKKQILDILEHYGLLFLIMCTEKCKKGSHNTSPNCYWSKGIYISWTQEQLIDFFSNSFKMIDCYLATAKRGHPCYVYIGEKKACT